MAASPTPAPKTAIPSRNGADLLYAGRVVKKRDFALIAGFALLGLPGSARATSPKRPSTTRRRSRRRSKKPPAPAKKPPRPAKRSRCPLRLPQERPRHRDRPRDDGLPGKLKNISPTASLFHLQVGFEPFKWLMVFGEGDLGFTSTRYTTVPRGYAIYGLGAGGRITVGLSDRVSVYGQVDFGMMEASNDELVTYGFPDADTLNGLLRRRRRDRVVPTRSAPRARFEWRRSQDPRLPALDIGRLRALLAQLGRASLHFLKFSEQRPPSRRWCGMRSAWPPLRSRSQRERGTPPPLDRRWLPHRYPSLRRTCRPRW